jgi:ParB family chromosome partitioning protein
VTRRGGLGRGLDALLPVGDAGVEHTRGAPMVIDVDAIAPNPRQPRQSFDEASIAELAESMRSLGVLQPLLVRRATGGAFELVAGERRLRAARRAGLPGVPVVVVDTDERGSLERALVENLHREDLNPMEEAAAYKQLLEEGSLTQEALAHRLGRSRVAITNSLRLLDLPVAVQRWLVEGRLTAAHGKALLGLAGGPFQERLARRAAYEGLSVRETEDLVRRYAAMAEPRAGAPRGEPPPPVSSAQRRLSDRLQTRVRVDFGKRKGRIVVDFSSLQELERLVGLVLGHADDAEPGVIRVE